VTTTITALEFQYNGADGVHVEFSKRDGPASLKFDPSTGKFVRSFGVVASKRVRGF